MAEEKGYFLTEQDRQILVRWIEQQKQIRANPTRQRSVPTDPITTPDVYMAKVTTAIPALTEAAGTGTGTNYTPGSATCDIYSIDLTTGRLRQQFNINKTVYNLSDTAVPIGWAVIHRDKFGSWVCGLGATSSSSGGSSSGGSSISDCDCYNCVPPSQAVIFDCSFCPDGALNQYHADFGTWPGITAPLGGDQYFTWVSSCLWQGPLIFIDGPGTGTGTGTPTGGGYYQWSYNSAAENSTLVLAWISGNDIAGIGA